MDSPFREMEETDEFMLVPEADDLRSYQLAEDADDAHDHEARFLAGNNEKTIDVNYFASEPTSDAAPQCGTAEAAAPSSAESEGSVEDDVDDVDGDLSDDDEGVGAEEVGVAEEPERKAAESEGSVDDDVDDVDGGRLSDGDEGFRADEVGVAEDQPERKDGDGDHGWQHHAVGVICSVGLAAAATGLALLLGGQQHTPHKIHFRAAGDRKAAGKVSARRGARLDQGIISFGGSYDGQRF